MSVTRITPIQFFRKSGLRLKVARRERRRLELFQL